MILIIYILYIYIIMILIIYILYSAIRFPTVHSLCTLSVETSENESTACMHTHGDPSSGSPSSLCADLSWQQSASD
jgi:hypothetical protein